MFYISRWPDAVYQCWSKDWYWSYTEGIYKRIDKFSSIERRDLYLYPLIFPDVYDLYPIVEDPVSNGTASCVVENDEYIRSGDCLDGYTLSGDEEFLWKAIDQRACAGASTSAAIRAKWMPYSHSVPDGCPLKDVSSIAIKQGASLDLGYHNAYQLHIYVDGGITPGQDLNAEVDSCNATWAFAIIAVDELMQGKLLGSSGGHVTFNSASGLFLGESNPTSFDPELYAQVMARIFIIQQHDMFKSQVPILIGYDNISAADCSFMKAAESSDSVLAGFAAALHIESTNLCSIEGFHVHSHLGHPWNELVDSICIFFKNRRPLVPVIPFAPLNRRVCFEYKLLLFAPLNRKFCLPP